MVEVSNAARVVFPEVGKTKGDVVAYYERLAPRLLAHVAGRPLSILRHPRGLAAPGFFQKNVPAHYPQSIARFEVKRQKGKTIYPVLSEPEHLAYLANQGMIELHVPTARADDLWHPDRLVIDLDPPPGEAALARRAARLVREVLGEIGVETAPLATGSKGYHVVASLAREADADAVHAAAHMIATMLAARHPDELTIAFRVASRGRRVFVDWLRNHPLATVVAPFSLRARPRATVATPFAWSDLDSTAPDAFTIDSPLEADDTIAALRPAEGAVAAIARAFEASGLVLEPFDRFRS